MNRVIAWLTERTTLEAEMTNILSFLFPPRLPEIPEAIERFQGDASENLGDGIISVKEKPYRNGIERFFAEAQ